MAKVKLSAISLLVLVLALNLTATPFALSEQQTSVRVWGESRVPALAVANLENGTSVGVVGEIRVRVLYPGEGRVYVSTEPLSDVDMQASVRAAVMIASYYAKANPLDYDFLVSITANSPFVGGPSAGAALVAAVYSALSRVPVNASVAATGMIMPDGLIGPVGGVPYKVQAAISEGYATVLVPLGQLTYTETVYKTETVGSLVVTRPVTVTWNVSDLATKLGGRALEVSTALDVIYWFTGETPLKVARAEPSLSEEEMALTAKEYREFLNLSESTRGDVQQKLKSLASSAVRSYAQQLLQSSESFAAQASAMWDSGYYYTGLSYAFVSAYQAMMAKYLVDSSLSSDPVSYLRGVRENISTTLEGYKEQYSKHLSRGSWSLDELFLLAEVHSRIRDAESALQAAADSLSSGDIAKASYYLGYAWGRARSLGYWLSLLDYAAARSAPVTQADRLASWILSYAYSSASYVDALKSTTGLSGYDTSGWYEMLSQASTLMASGDYPGALDLSLDVLASSSIAIQSLFSLNLSATARVLSDHSRLILANSETSPASARLYLMMGDSYLSQGDYKDSITYYERALVILYASTMAVQRDGGSPGVAPTESPTEAAGSSKPAEGAGSQGQQSSPAAPPEGGESSGTAGITGIGATSSGAIGQLTAIVILILAGAVAILLLRRRA